MQADEDVGKIAMAVPLLVCEYPCILYLAWHLEAPFLLNIS